MDPYIKQEPYINPKDTTLRDYFGIFFRHKLVFIFTVIVPLLTVFVGFKMVTPTYEATVKMVLLGKKTTSATYYQDINVQGFMLATEGEILKSTTIMGRTVSVLGLHKIPLDYEKIFSSRLKGFFIDLSLKDLKSKLEKLKPEKREGFIQQGCKRINKKGKSRADKRYSKYVYYNCYRLQPCGSGYYCKYDKPCVCHV